MQLHFKIKGWPFDFINYKAVETDLDESIFVLEKDGINEISQCQLRKPFQRKTQVVFPREKESMQELKCRSSSSSNTSLSILEHDSIHG